MTPEEALFRVVHCLDRAHDTGFKTKAFVRALDVVREHRPGRDRRAGRGRTLTELDGIGDCTAASSPRRWPGRCRVSHQARAETQLAMTRRRRATAPRCGATAICTRRGATAAPRSRRWRRRRSRSATSTWCSPTTRPRLTIAHGLDRERLDASSTRSPRSTARSPPDFRILTGMEVDILEDGSLDLGDDARPPRRGRGQRPLEAAHGAHGDDRAHGLAVANPHVDILGHCTGRMIGKRPESTFDADFVFAACAQFGTAVEINCRPERLDPPRRADRPGDRVRLLVLDRHRRPRHRPARVAAARLRPGRRARRADRAGHQHDAGRRPRWPGPRVADAHARSSARPRPGRRRVRRRQRSWSCVAIPGRPGRPGPREREVAVMRHLARHGYPVPARARPRRRRRRDGAAARRHHVRAPWRPSRGGRGELADQLGRPLTPASPPSPFGDLGERGVPLALRSRPTSIIHLDFHPDNVMLTKQGPIVFDWTNAALGPAAADVAQTWVVDHATSTHRRHRGSSGSP